MKRAALMIAVAAGTLALLSGFTQLMLLLAGAR